MRILVLVYATTLLGQPDAATVMSQAAANVEKAADARKQYVYQQSVRSSLTRSSGQRERRERREYSVIPNETRTDKKLVSFQGEYRKGKQMLAYTEPGFRTKGGDIDGELIEELTRGLIDDKDSRDGIPRSLFPLSSRELAFYRFAMNGETVMNGRRTYRITFEPLKKGHCIHIGGDESNDCEPTAWKGETWIDAEDLQPARIITELAFRIPWGVRVFLGTNVQQTGFSITYYRAGENVWFPATYGTEFRLNVLWGYRRTIALSMESSGFQKTSASSTIEYDLPKQ